MAGAYIYDQHVEMAFTPLADVDAPDGSVKVALLDAVEFPAGVQEDNPFWTFYEGAVTFDTSINDGYVFGLQVTHEFSDGVTYRSPPRPETYRVNRNSPFTLPLGTFNSRSVIPSGSFTAEQLARPVAVTIELTVSNIDDKPFTCDLLDHALMAVSFVQFDDGRIPAYTPPSTVSGESLKQRIDATLEANAWDVVQLPTQAAPDKVMATYMGAQATGTDMAHRVEVVHWLAVQRETNIEQRVESLLDILAHVEDCYPMLSQVIAAYPDHPVAVSVSRSARWCQVSVVCTDRG